MKRFWFFLILLLLLTSCGSDDTQDSLTTESWSSNIFQSDEFSIAVPTKWNVITDDSNILPKPKSWEIALAATSNELRYGFTSNLLVLSQHVSKPVTSLDFSVLNNIWSTKDFLEYTKLDSKNIDFPDKDTSVMYTFEARYNTDTPKLKYIQIGKVCYFKNAFLITIAISPDVKDLTRYEDLVKTFHCKP